MLPAMGSHGSPALWAGLHAGGPIFRRVQDCCRYCQQWVPILTAKPFLCCCYLLSIMSLSSGPLGTLTEQLQGCIHYIAIYCMAPVPTTNAPTLQPNAEKLMAVTDTRVSRHARTVAALPFARCHTLAASPLASSDPGGMGSSCSAMLNSYTAGGTVYSCMQDGTRIQTIRSYCCPISSVVFCHHCLHGYVEPQRLAGLIDAGLTGSDFAVVVNMQPASCADALQGKFRPGALTETSCRRRPRPCGGGPGARAPARPAAAQSRALPPPASPGCTCTMCSNTSSHRQAGWSERRPISFECQLSAAALTRCTHKGSSKPDALLLCSSNPCSVAMTTSSCTLRPVESR